MLSFRHQLSACFAALGLASAAAWGAVDITDVQVTNVGTTALTVVWTTSEVSTPGLQVFSDSGGVNAVTSSLGLDYYPLGEGDPAVVNDAAARTSRRELEVLAINRRIVAVRVIGLAPGTTYYLRPRTLGNGGVDNGSGLLPLREVKTASWTEMVTDGRLLRVRFPGLSGAGLVALLEGPAGTAPLSAFVGDGLPADTAVFPLAGLIDTTTGTNAVLNGSTQIAIRVLGANAPVGTFPHTVDFTSTFNVARLDLAEVGGPSPSPVFTAHPESKIAQVGAAATFSAAATGTPAPTFKWQRLPSGSGTWVDLTDGGAYGGTSTATLQVSGATLAMSGDQFRSIASNGVLPNATSNPATLTVVEGPAAPTISTHPVNVAVNAGGSATFSVVATGNPAPSYQWRKGGNDIAGATASSLTLNPVAAGDAGSYTVVVSNVIEGQTKTATSNSAALTVYVVPVITTPPVAQTIVAGQSASFSVVAVGPPDPRYQWKKNGVNLINATNAGLTLASVPSSDDGALISVEVSNTAAGGLGGTATSSAVLLTVNPVAPSFVSTPPNQVSAVQGLTFLYGPITINNTPATFEATGLPPGLSVNPLNGTVSGIPNVVGALPASFPVVLKATNRTGTANWSFTIEVKPPPPQITSVAAASGQVGVDFSYVITATNSPTSFGAAGLPTGLFVNQDSGAITGIPVGSGIFNATVSAANAGGVTSQGLVITIAPAPSAPIYGGGAAPAGTQGTEYSLAVVFSGSPTSYAVVGGALPAGLILNGGTGVIAGTPTAVGEFDVTVRATNPGGSADAVLKIVVNPAASAPVITSASTISTTVGANFSFTLTASGNPSVFTFFAGNRPAWLNLNDSTGVLSGTPVLGTYTLPVHATNSPSANVTLQGPESLLVIRVDASPNAPVISSGAVVPGRVGQGVSYQLAATPSPSSYAVVSASPPGWLILNQTSGSVTGTPDAAGLVKVTFAANHATFGQGPGLEVLFDIAPALQAPVITSSGVALGHVGQPFQYAITAAGEGVSGYGLSGALPAGLSFAAGTGVVSGIPQEATASPVIVVVTASNNAGKSEGKSVEITILPPPATPIIMSPLAVSGRMGEAFSYQMVASENATAYLASGLPGGLNVNSATGVISGSPQQAGTFQASLRAANANGIGEISTLTLTIAPALTAPRIVSLPAASGQMGAVFSYRTDAEPGPILAFALNGRLPRGLVFNTATGVISGQPTEQGLFRVNLTATNAAGTSMPQPLVIYLRLAAGAPTITSPTVGLATVGEDYSYLITATNMPSLRPYVPPNALDADGLPPGLAVNPAMGVIEGKPTVPGSYSVTLVGTNTLGTGTARTLRLVIRPSTVAPKISSVPTAAGQVGVPFRHVLAASNLPTSFEAMGLPDWAVFNSQTGEISGLPTTPGVHEVRTFAANAAGRGDILLLVINIAPGVGAPLITSSRSAFGRLGQAFRYEATASPAATSFVATGLPNGLNINGATGVISGSPLASGRFDVSLRAVNGSGSGTPIVLVIEISSDISLGGGS